jgi:dihydroxyacetone kinase-like protein
LILEALLDVAEEHLEGPVEEDATSPTVPDEAPDEETADDAAGDDGDAADEPPEDAE